MDAATFIGDRGECWTRVGLIPWNSTNTQNVFLIFNFQIKTGLGPVFDWAKRFTATEQMAEALDEFTVVKVTIIPLEQVVAALVRRKASFKNTVERLEAWVAFQFPDFAFGKKLKWHLPQCDRFASATPHIGTDKNPSLEKVVKYFSTANTTFPSIRMEVTGVDEPEIESDLMQRIHNARIEEALTLFTLTDSDGKLQMIGPEAPMAEVGKRPVPPVYFQEERVDELVRTWDEQFLKPRTPAMGCSTPTINIINTATIDDLVRKVFHKLPKAEATPDRLRDIAAAALMDKIPPPFTKYTSINKLAEVLEHLANIDENTERLELLEKAELILRHEKISTKTDDLWLELAIWGRKILEKMWEWVKKLRTNPFRIPADMVFYEVAKKVSSFNSDEGRMHLSLLGNTLPPSLVATSKRGEFLAIVVDYKTVKVLLLPKFVPKEMGIFEKEFVKVVESLKELASEHISVDLPRLIHGIKNNCVSWNEWRKMVDEIKEWPAVKTCGYWVYRLPNLKSPLAIGLSKTLGPILKDLDDRRFGTICKTWAARFGQDPTHTYERPMVQVEKPFFQPMEWDFLVDNWEEAPVFKKRVDSALMCGAHGCVEMDVDFMSCAKCFQLTSDLLVKENDSLMVPTFKDNKVKTFAIERTTYNQPMDLYNSKMRAQFLRDALALHNPTRNYDIPNKAIVGAAMRRYGNATEIRWGSRELLGNEKLVNAVELVLAEHEHVNDPEFLEAWKTTIPLELMPRLSAERMYIPTPHFRPIVSPTDQEIEDSSSDSASSTMSEQRPLEIREIPSAYTNPEVKPPPLGYYAMAYKQRKGLVLVVRMDESIENTRILNGPTVIKIANGREMVCIDNSTPQAELLAHERAAVEELGFNVGELTQKMRELASYPYQEGKIHGFPELTVLNEYAARYKHVSFVVHADSFILHQHMKLYWQQLRLHRATTEEQNFTITTLRTESEALPQCYFVSKAQAHVKIWRPIRKSLTQKIIWNPKHHDQVKDLEFYGHMVAATYFEPGLAAENLIGLPVRDLFPKIDNQNARIRERIEDGANMLALMFELNDKDQLDSLVVGNGSLSVKSSQWQERFHFSAKQRERMRNHQEKNIRRLQLEGLGMMRNHFPEVFNSAKMTEWLEKKLKPDIRFHSPQIMEGIRKGFLESLHILQTTQNEKNRRVETALEKVFTDRKGEPAETNNPNRRLPIVNWMDANTTGGLGVLRKMEEKKYRISTLFLQENIKEGRPYEEAAKRAKRRREVLEKEMRQLNVHDLQDSLDNEEIKVPKPLKPDSSEYKKFSFTIPVDKRTEEDWRRLEREQEKETEEALKKAAERAEESDSSCTDTEPTTFFFVPDENVQDWGELMCADEKSGSSATASENTTITVINKQPEVQPIQPEEVKSPESGETGDETITTPSRPALASNEVEAEAEEEDSGIQTAPKIDPTQPQGRTTPMFDQIVENVVEADEDTDVRVHYSSDLQGTLEYWNKKAEQPETSGDHPQTSHQGQATETADPTDPEEKKRAEAAEEALVAQVQQLGVNPDELNSREKAVADWLLNGLKIVPSKQNQQLKFQRGMENRVKVSLELEVVPEEVMGAESLVALPPVKEPVAQAQIARRLLPEFGINSPQQTVARSQIVVDLTAQEIRKVHRMALFISDVAVTGRNMEFVEEEAQELCAILHQKPLAVTQTIANFAKEDSALRCDIIRRELAKAVKKLRIQGGIRLWAMDFLPLEEEAEMK
ncbi:Oidioi.mRNA.OKI2018_I69.chr2.g8095.t1.cds [Oikopleura dioica]|uniref:Oidioi.mRNA.OKI2018_I69.chr2.g8095.t1.cds n=1 Tax=Oikopleura dioica TaxID=34765 RepID=A0ABN7TCV3_OIKDI|nr:Oidioi.mRNA.OKI2018_I69.chr2.g8095.t1.cds [Oikopleura dioica]